MRTAKVALLLPVALAGMACESSAESPETNTGPGVIGGSAGYVYGGQCPPSPPADGSACVPAPQGDDVICEYGDDPRGELCHALATCVHQTWNVVGVSPSCRPARDPGACPASAEAARDQSCAVSGSFCIFGVVPCECTSCTGGRGLDLQSCAGDTTWHCAAANPSNDPACPPAARNLGTTCDTESIMCEYGCPSDNVRTCARGIWVPAQSSI
jgi:hypothetical protein